jgi:hypothetical protein
LSKTGMRLHKVSGRKQFGLPFNGRDYVNTRLNLPALFFSVGLVSEANAR